MRQDPAYFEGKEPILVYIAKRLDVLFRSVRVGAFFYVLPETVDAVHELMRRNGYKPHVGSGGTS